MTRHNEWTDYAKLYSKRRKSNRPAGGYKGRKASKVTVINANTGEVTEQNAYNAVQLQRIVGRHGNSVPM